MLEREISLLNCHCIILHCFRRRKIEMDVEEPTTSFRSELKGWNIQYLLFTESYN